MNSEMLKKEAGGEFPVVPGVIVQLNPETCRNRMLAGCMMTVTEPKNWGAQGYVQAIGQHGKQGGLAYYRAKWEEMEPTGGIAAFMPVDEIIESYGEAGIDKPTE